MPEAKEKVKKEHVLGSLVGEGSARAGGLESSTLPTITAQKYNFYVSVANDYL